jgi:hypothetical protein
MDEWERKFELRGKIQRFLRSRRNDETKQYIASIIGILETARVEDAKKKSRKEDAGWVRVKILLDELVGPDKIIKNATTFYRLVNDLSRQRIIDRKVLAMPEERKRKATFYRTTGPYQRWWFLSREQLEENYAKDLQCLRELVQHLVIARTLLEELGCPDPQQKISEEYTALLGREPHSTFELVPEHGPAMAYVQIKRLHIPVHTKQDSYWLHIRHRTKKKTSESKKT